MTVADSTKRKLSKPYPEHPLFAHNNGQWCRKIRGKLIAFGSCDDHAAALEKHNAEYEFLKEGIAPPESFDGWRVGDVVNEFLPDGTIVNPILKTIKIAERIEGEAGTLYKLVDWAEFFSSTLPCDDV